ncbi:MAG: hypothetical protein S0880_23320 [Actinomycetota bacterium]|nr:hypothetical protein [Actinomycetota bacterium]
MTPRHPGRIPFERQPSRPVRRAVAVLLVAGLSVAAGCGDDDATDAGTPTTSATSTATSTTSAAPDGDDPSSGTTDTSADEADEPVEPAPEDGADAPAPVSVEVLDAGDEPRQLLDASAELGSEEAVTIRQEQQVEITMGGGVPQTVTNPPVLYDLAYTITDVADDGAMTVETFYEDVRVAETEGVDPTVLAAVEQTVDVFIGATARIVVEPDGTIAAWEAPDIDLSSTPGASAATLLEGFEEQASSLSVPFPAEPVGTGARWETTSESSVGGLDIVTTTTWELRSLSDGEMVLATEVVLEYVPGTYEVEGVEIEVIDGTLTGQGTTTRQPGQVFGLSDMVTEGTVTMELTQGGQTGELVQTIRQTSTMTAR